MCACKQPPPAYAGRYGFQNAGRPDPSCPTCRLGAFTQSDPRPAVLNTGYIAPAGQPEIAPMPSLPSLTPTDLLQHLRIEHMAFLAMSDAERTNLLRQVFGDTAMVEKIKAHMEEFCRTYAQTHPAGYPVPYIRYPTSVASPVPPDDDGVVMAYMTNVGFVPAIKLR